VTDPTRDDPDRDLARAQAGLEETRFRLELAERTNRRLETRLRKAEELVGGLTAERDNLKKRLGDHAAIERVAARGFRIARKLRDRVRKVLGGP
jgi:hypothetical protein